MAIYRKKWFVLKALELSNLPHCYLENTRGNSFQILIIHYVSPKSKRMKKYHFINLKKYCHMDHYHIYPNNNPVKLSNTDTVISKLKKKKKENESRRLRNLTKTIYLLVIETCFLNKKTRNLLQYHISTVSTCFYSDTKRMCNFYQNPKQWALTYFPNCEVLYYQQLNQII